MNKQSFTFLGIIAALILCNFLGVTHASNNNSSLTTVAKTTPARKIKNSKDAYEVVMKYHKTNSKNSSYKNNGKIKNGYEIKYYNDVGQLMVYQVTLAQHNTVKIQKNNDKKIINLNHKKLQSFTDAVSALRDALPYQNMKFKLITKKPNMFVVNVFKNDKYSGTYSLKVVTNKYNRIIEDDSRFELPANLHEKILNNKEREKLIDAIKIVRKYRNKKLSHYENKKFNTAKKLIAYDNKPN
ncbi:hypothetical protein [Apilactobacillus timberlakei]|uniref:PepSY domain-containing protein n=1 Tax=Apilactobacillus timberlakei TaxID=2008380 RepID=A0ABY2YSP6_9LACO|nr:hypothetical protein [Apilactobacillus timberlakei]TPR13183.1 hypothetical protein DYZ97_04665 [Apilactobacillus timberlakei]TPR14232.1 hypothetical protein DY048_04610 [Apilactobacillus timberlakei]TPR16485.1 hypothetical protein DY052_02700 [Apilactobacillus timberlakei]TPR19173.1 hypothetical protein DYZ95_00730 [Apilactobacillus timberlakei]TPR23313.1 hypothetical protein DY102_04530 [Apilactobacillus timberlakei]